MEKKWTMITSLIVLFLIGGVLAGPVMSDVEKPDYKVIQSEHNIEIRPVSYTHLTLPTSDLV